MSKEAVLSRISPDLEINDPFLGVHVLYASECSYLNIYGKAHGYFKFYYLRAMVVMHECEPRG